jgi:hypothetical protein
MYVVQLRNYLPEQPHILGGCSERRPSRQEFRVLQGLTVALSPPFRGKLLKLWSFSEYQKNLSTLGIN